MNIDDAKELYAVLILVNVVSTLHKYGMIKDESPMSQEGADAVFDSMAKDIVEIMSEWAGQ